MQGLLPRLVCLGNLTIDDVYLPDGTFQAHCSGGNALYASISGRLWELATEMVAPIGIDFPKSVSDLVKSRKLRLDGIPSRSIASIYNEVFYDEDGGRIWNKHTSEGEFQILSPSPEDIPEEYLQAKIFLVSAMTLNAQENIVNWLRKNVDGLIALDVRDTYIEGNESRILNMVSKVDIFIPSEVEARRISGHKEWDRVTREFSKLGPRLVIIKLGAKGSVIYKSDLDLLIPVPAYPTKVVDTTGAGDSYCGGFLATYLYHADDLELCGRAGAVSSSFTVSDFGATGILNATPEDAKRRLAEWMSI